MTDHLRVVDAETEGCYAVAWLLDNNEVDSSLIPWSYLGSGWAGVSDADLADAGMRVASQEWSIHAPIEVVR